MIESDANTNNPPRTDSDGFQTDNQIQPSSDDPRNIAAWNVLTQNPKGLPAVQNYTDWRYYVSDIRDYESEGNFPLYSSDN